MTMPAKSLVALLVVLSVALPTSHVARALQGQRATAPDAYVREVEAWRTLREAELRANDGWLTLVGLHWLREGTNRVGGSPAADVPLPVGSAAPTVGTIMFAGGIARFEPEPGVDVRINGARARTQVLRPQPGKYDVVTTGSVTFFVIKRGERYGVRVRDQKSAVRRTFPGLHWYPVSADYRVKARFAPHPEPTSVMIANVLGTIEAWPTPGRVSFTLGGRQHTLTPVLEGPDAKALFFIFRDGTSGSGTYPGGRFLYAQMPVNGEVVLDFNKAHSPPCAFTPFATCPLPPKENALAIRIEAGELDPHR